MGETPLAHAGCRKPLSRREQSRGPQYEVNAAASSDYQPKGVWESRVAHVTTKAMDTALDPERVVALPGVRAAARGDSSVRNRRGPTRPPTSGNDPSYKLGVKWTGAERESEGLIVLLRPGESREEGRGPALVTLCVEGKCEGMVVRPNNPRKQTRELQQQLFKIAKWDRGRGYLTFSKWIFQGDVLAEVRKSAILGPRMRLEKTIGQPCGGNLHARLERGPQETGPYGNCA